MQEHTIECKSFSLGDITTYLEVLEDICRKGSSLHEALARNIGCIKERVREGCLKGKIRRVARSYRNSHYTPGNEHFTEEQWSKLNCMLYAYEVTCAADAASPCGNTVKNAIIEVARRVDYLRQMGGCTRSVTAEIIKDIPNMHISPKQELLLEELLLEI
ncbi:uncharacterized protein LOC118202867 [Stegodyphus dumicola]|uniref:uncharacterized protein LOC118202867 n=1 Tax=Stegodyphus dumicola TaxID=202533 RepID=UPI0015A7F3D9|nr:uncharacterized protein LOC118202867 [Stegodyphus dumicola]